MWGSLLVSCRQPYCVSAASSTMGELKGRILLVSLDVNSCLFTKYAYLFLIILVRVILGLGHVLRLPHGLHGPLVRLLLRHGPLVRLLLRHGPLAPSFFAPHHPSRTHSLTLSVRARSRCGSGLIHSKFTCTHSPFLLPLRLRLPFHVIR